ncbi:hypothetical protein K2173_016036 [Erythroxylum novogranatense]|uniref:Tetraspanin-15-like n=1 Tax=Erythroxylum novogranatense TaxID=1862640 RepID=A0AAV8SFZ6_9ROSI|nr:hypothetical protein K2173_016036 [Erythroxylum novogranatense]
MAENPKAVGPIAVMGAPAEEPKKPKANDEAPQGKSLSGLVSIVTCILSLPILASAIWLLYMKDYDCEKLIKLPSLQTGLGIGLIFMFLVSNVAVFLRSRLPVPGLFMVMVPLIVILTMGLALVGANKLESGKIVATPMWFKRKIHQSHNWENIKACLYSTEICEDLASRSLALKGFDFSVKKLSFIEFGCCKPPEICGMEYVNATFWKRDGSRNMDNPYVSDCNKWSNDPIKLCYDCDTCKQGFMKTMESKWWKLGLFLILTSLLLIVSHILLFVAVMWERYGG